jgi:hypothetical protein
MKLTVKTPLSKSIKEIITIEIVFLAVFLIPYGISTSFPDYIKVQGVTELMQSLVAVDGVILGFTGVVFAQLFSSVMDQQNTIFGRMLSNKKIYHQYENFLEEYSKRKTALVISTISSFTLLLASILTSLVGLARMSTYNATSDTYSPFFVSFFPLLFLVEAVFVLVIALVALPMGPPKPNEKMKQVTLNEQIKP